MYWDYASLWEIVWDCTGECGYVGMWVIHTGITPLYRLWCGIAGGNEDMLVSFLLYRNDSKLTNSVDPDQTASVQMRLFLEGQSDQGIHCLPFRLHLLDSLLYGKATETGALRCATLFCVRLTIQRSSLQRNVIKKRRQFFLKPLSWLLLEALLYGNITLFKF